MELWERKNYLSDLPFIFNSYIREYDISKANINILLWKKVLNRSQYEQLMLSPRDVRQYTIGMMQRNDEKVKKILEEGFCECRKMFIQSNGLTDVDILSIKNDAIYIINKIPTYTQFDNINFLNKNTYTSYMSLNKKHIELYYVSDKIKGIEKIDVKGISDEKIEKHKEYFLDFIYFFFDMIQSDALENLIHSFQTFYQNYVNRKLDIGYYRTFNEISSFSLLWNRNLNLNLSYLIDSEEMMKQYPNNIDISFNMNLLREMYQYLTMIYFSSKARK